MQGNVGRRSNRTKPGSWRARVIELVWEHYCGEGQERFGPTLAGEHLAAEHGIAVDAETLRRWMLVEGLGSRRRRRKPQRRRRQRKAHFGEMLQLDGSHHEWLEGHGPKGCLMNLVADATGRGLYRFSREETTWAAADLLLAWVRRYGVPRALYCDYKNVYQRRPTSREAIEGVEPQTQFGRMCGKLGIRMVAASSPQAKGRVERHHGTHEDRLIKKMRLRGIADYEVANRYLDEEYLEAHNAKFAREAALEADFHRRLERSVDLRWMMCLEAERTVSNDQVVRFENRILQLQPKHNQHLGRGARVIVQQARDGELSVLCEQGEVAFEPIARPPEKQRPAIPPRARAARPPVADHPSHRPCKSLTRFPHSHSHDNDGSLLTYKGAFLLGYPWGHFYWALTQRFRAG